MSITNYSQMYSNWNIFGICKHIQSFVVKHIICANLANHVY